MCPCLITLIWVEFHMCVCIYVWVSGVYLVAKLCYDLNLCGIFVGIFTWNIGKVLSGWNEQGFFVKYTHPITLVGVFACNIPLIFCYEMYHLVAWPVGICLFFNPINILCHVWYIQICICLIYNGNRKYVWCKAVWRL